MYDELTGLHLSPLPTETVFSYSVSHNFFGNIFA